MTDERRGAAPTSRGEDDAFDRELRRLLAVDPSPEFEARVRARVAGEPSPSAWRAGWRWMTFGGATAAALVLAVAVSRPELPGETDAEPAGATIRTGDVAPPPADTVAPLEEDGPAVDPSLVASIEPTTVPVRAVAGIPPADPRAAAPPAAAASPPGPPRFTRVVFSESERTALRQLLALARDRQVVAPAPAEPRMPVAGGEPPAELDVPPVTIEPPAELVIPPIAIDPPITIEPLNVALLDTGADQ